MQTPAAATDEVQRLQVLRSFEILDTEPEPAFDRITALVAHMFDMPIALVSLVDHDRQWFKSCIGLDINQTGRDVSFCAHAIASADTFVVRDAGADPRFHDNPLVTGPPFIRFYAGAPIEVGGGHRLGTVCVIDSRTRPDFGAHEMELLEHFAQIVADALEMRRTNLRVREAVGWLDDSRETAAGSARAALAAGRLRTEFLARASHELGSPVSAIHGFAQLLCEQPLESEAADYARRILASTEKLRSVLQRIFELATTAFAPETTSGTPTAIAALVAAVADGYAASLPAGALTTSISSDATVVVDPDRLRRALGHLIDNALTHGGGAVAISCHDLDDTTIVRVRDQGPGVPTVMRPRLFEPFLRGGGGRADPGIGLGLAVSKALLTSMGASVELNEAVTTGAELVITLPHA